MENALALVLFSIITAVTLPALIVTVSYLLPQRVERARLVIETRPGRMFGLGLVNALFFSLLAAALGEQGELGGLLALLIVGAILTISLIGLVSLMRLLHERIFGPDQGWLARLKTAVLLTAALLTPLIGWFILTPLLLLTGLGGAIRTLIRPRQKRPPMEIGS